MIKMEGNYFTMSLRMMKAVWSPLLSLPLCQCHPAVLTGLSRVAGEAFDYAKAS